MWSYFLGTVLCEVSDVFLPSCPQILSLLKFRMRGIFEPHNCPSQRQKAS